MTSVARSASAKRISKMSLNRNTGLPSFKIRIIDGVRRGFSDEELEIKSPVITAEARLQRAFVFITVNEDSSRQVRNCRVIQNLRECTKVRNFEL